MSNPLEELARKLKTPGRQAALNDILAQTLARFDSQTGTIHLLDGEKQTLHLAAHIGLPPAMLDVVRLIPAGKGIAGQVVARNAPVTICNLQMDAGGLARPGAKQTGVGGALCVPIRTGGKIAGALGVGAVRQREYTAAETHALGEIAALIGSNL
ncbi:MAG: GAF domain-containing protein [Verrucomicrobiota bacterium]|nr:GAF domain-containing protein [Verrucomicrobiota bacterium]